MSRLKIRSVLLVAGVILGPVRAAHADGPAPSFCSSQLALVQQYLGPIPSVGMMIVTFKLGEVFPCFFNSGEIELGSGQAPDADTIFELASVTKVFTTAILAMRAQQGLNVYAPVKKKFLPPGYSLQMAEQDVTFQQLATFTGGFSWSQPPGYTTGASYPQEEFETQVNLLIPTNSIPGETNSLPTLNKYSNGSVGFLGQILMYMDLSKDTFGAKEFSNWISANLTGPLGMNATAVDPGGTRAKGYKYTLSSDPNIYPYTREPPFPWEPWGAAGGLRSNINDMLIFLKANICAHHQNSPYCAGFPKNILDALWLAHQPNDYFPSGALLLDKTIYIGNGPGEQAWAWGYLPPPVSTSNGTAIISKNGGHPGFSSFIGFDPDKGYGLVVLMNTHQKALAAAGKNIIQATPK